jgi:hypothetical protein
LPDVGITGDPADARDGRPDVPPAEPDASKDSTVVPADTARLDSPGFPDVASGLLDAGEAESGSTPLVPCTGTPQTFTYDGTATPDSTAFASTWSTRVTSGASWTSNGSELIMTSSAGAGVWFGKDPSYNPVSWSLAPGGQGNALSIRCKLGPNSQGFNVRFYDETGGLLEPQVLLMPGYIRLRTGVGSDTTYSRYDVDTSVYHTYLLRLEAWTRSYEIDGVEISIDRATPSTGSSSPSLIIGDASGPDPDPVVGWETGTFYVDEVVFKTYTSCAPK